MSAENQFEPVVELAVDDPDDFEALYGELRGIPGLAVEAVPALMPADEQGSMLEFLTVACSGGAVTAALQLVKSIVESRGPKFTLTARRGKERLKIKADNIDEALPLLKELLDGP